MKKLIVVVMFMMMGLAGIAESQTSSARVVLSTNMTSAKQGDLITVQALINSPDARIAGADIEVSVDPICLRIERLDLGQFLPTAEGQGYIVKQEQNEISARLVVTVLNVNLSAQGDGVYMSIPLRVMCESGTTQVNITRSELVDDLTNQFTAQTQSIELNIQPSVPIEENPPQDNTLLIAILVVATSAFGLVILMMVYRRKQAKDKELALAKKPSRR